jgi:chromosome segregation ATPase
MARLGVTKEDVFSACAALMKEGVTITVANVRQELGTGSYTTLLPLIDDFKNNIQSEANLKDEIPSLPLEIKEMSQNLIQDLWWQAALQAQKRGEEVSRKFEKEIEELRKELASKAEELSQAMTDIKTLEEETDRLKKEVSQFATVQSAKDGETALLKTQLKEKESEIKTYLERAVSAEKELEYVNKKNKS